MKSPPKSHCFNKTPHRKNPSIFTHPSKVSTPPKTFQLPSLDPILDSFSRTNNRNSIPTSLPSMASRDFARRTPFATTLAPLHPPLGSSQRPDFNPDPRREHPSSNHNNASSSIPAPMSSASTALFLAVQLPPVSSALKDTVSTENAASLSASRLKPSPSVRISSLSGSQAFACPSSRMARHSNSDQMRPRSAAPVRISIPTVNFSAATTDDSALPAEHSALPTENCPRQQTRSPHAQTGLVQSEEQVRNSPLMKELMVIMENCSRSKAVNVESGFLMVPKRRRNENGFTNPENLLYTYGYSRGDEDVEYCLEDTPGLSKRNFEVLRNSLLENLQGLRDFAEKEVDRFEEMLESQASCRFMSLDEVDARFKHLVGMFIKGRKHMMDRYRLYVKNRRWIENVATRQRKGCLQHRQNNMLRLWLFNNFENPYPDAKDKDSLMRDTGLTMTQINNWLINARSRVWKPTIDMMSGADIQRVLYGKEENGAASEGREADGGNQEGGGGCSSAEGGHGDEELEEESSQGQSSVDE